MFLIALHVQQVHLLICQIHTDALHVHREVFPHAWGQLMRQFAQSAQLERMPVHLNPHFVYHVLLEVIQPS